MINLNLSCPINKLSYGYASINILKELNKQANISLFPINSIRQEDITNQDEANILSQCIKRSELFDAAAPSIRIYHQNRMAESIGRGKRIGFPIFELDRFTSIERNHLRSLDEIFVCSKWAANVVEENIHVAAKVVPLGVDPTIFNTDCLQPKQNNKTVFLNIGKWEIRKGHDILVDAFNLAFSKNDNVELWMVPFNFFIGEKNDEWASLYKNSDLGDKIKIFGRLQNQSDLVQIMSQADVGVFPSRAEGWNLPLLEMLSLGKQCITTNYSAHTEFCNNDNCSLIEIDELETAYDGVWFHGYGNWAALQEKQIDQLVHYMRDLHRNNKFNIYGVAKAKTLTWWNTAFHIMENL